MKFRANCQIDIMQLTFNVNGRDDIIQLSFRLKRSEMEKSLQYYKSIRFLDYA